MAELVLGPLVRYVAGDCATVWVETDAPCEVEVLGHAARTFGVCGHHYALVCVDGLEPGRTYEYEVALDGERAWPQGGSDFPPSVIKTIDGDGPIDLAFGSCRLALPHEPPYSLPKEVDERGRGIDALRALALEIVAGERELPDMILLLGDQVYADEVSLRTLDYIESRPGRPESWPAREVVDYEEYCHLYQEAWQEPVIRWLLSTVSTSMVIDDHDMHDDWNISRAWCEEMERKAWWRERSVSGIMAYWIYQFIGNLSPRELGERPLPSRVRQLGDATDELRAFAEQNDSEREGKRWSFHRDFGRTRLVVMDSRSGRILDEGERAIVDEREWEWIRDCASGDFDHLLLGTSDPFLLTPAFHNLEMWNEAICDGAWGGAAARLGERLRQALDFDHWGAFGRSFASLARLLEEVGSGERGDPPASIVVLSGDVHHAYLAEVAFRRGSGVRSRVWQAVCSPYRNALDTHERRAIEVALSRPAEAAARALCRAGGVDGPPIGWRFVEGPAFDNQIASLRIDGRRAKLILEKTPRDPEGRDERLETGFERELA